MLHAFDRRAAVVLAIVATAGCTVHNKEVPALSGPSTFALSLTLSAIPDAISQDGGSQASIRVLAIGPDGKAVSALPMRVDMFVDGVGQDYGTLSARTIVTNTDGVATVVYTAPPSPSNGVYKGCNSSSLPGNCVTIKATPTGTNFQTSTSEGVTIRLVPPGVILPPASTPTAAFAFSPQPATANLPLQFDASSSQVGGGASQIVSYNWTFGDGTTGTGKTVTHTYSAQNTYNVTLTVTNDRNLSASTTQPVNVGSAALPTPVFTVSPTAPAVGQQVFFNASTSRPGAGGSISSYRWTFGDGATGSGVSTSHAYTAVGNYTVQLTVTDVIGLSATSTGTPVTVSAGGAATLPTAKFTSSPTSPAVNQSVFFNASSSTPAPGHTLATYAWDFGDGTPGGTGVTPTHAFALAGTFNVTLVVTDDLGQTGTASAGVTVTSASGGGGATIATFTFSPLTPSALQPVFFNASASSSASGRTLTTYAWNFGDGTLITGSTFSASHTFAAAGTFTVTLTVTDDIGQTGRVATPVTVSAAGSGSLTADFSISPTDPRSGQLVTFNANLSSPAASITSYDWDFGDGVVVNGQTGFLISHTYFTATGNSFTIRLTVHDNTGRVQTTTKPLTVIAGTDPTASFTVSPSPATVSPAVVTFDGSSSTAVAPKTIARYTWDFGDGSAIFSPVPPTTTTSTHSYAATGTYVIRLTVTDSAGLSGSTTRTLLVQ